MSTTSAPRRDEQFAFGVVAQITGASVIHADTRGAPPGTVDAWIDYPDGTRGALEVTTLGEPEEFQLHSLVRRHKSDFPNPGKLLWTLRVAHPRELPRLKSLYGRAILLMEMHGVQHIEQLASREVGADADLEWLQQEAESTLHGYSSIPKGRHESVILSSGSLGAIWSSDGDEIASALSGALTGQLVRDHIDKLLRHQAAERHLFLIVGLTGLTPAAVIALMGPELVPSEDPELPSGITHLWLTAGFGQELLVWQRGSGWSIAAFS